MMRTFFVLSLALLASCPMSEAQPLHDDIVQVINVDYGDTIPGGLAWADSYSDGESCYCMSNFDHGIGDFYLKTPLGFWMTVRQVCAILGPGPGHEGRPIYNDVQCGNGPPNDAGDEHFCPGRVDIGPEGCRQIGPEWNFEPFMSRVNPQNEENERKCRETFRRESRPKREDRLGANRNRNP